MQGHPVNLPDWRARAQQAMHLRWVKIAAAAAGVLIVLGLVVPLFVNADTFRPMLESQISSALGRKVTLGHLSFSLFTGSLKARDIAIADDPAFSSTPFLQAKSLHIGIQTGALLFHHQVKIRTFTVDAPEIHLISNQNSVWNYASFAHGQSGASGNQQPASPSDLTLGDLKIKNGSVIVSSVPATTKPFAYTNVNLRVQHLSFTQAMPFDLSADLPGNGTVELSGTAGPIPQQDATSTPLRASLTVKHFDPVAAGVLPANEGVSMVADITAQLASDGKTVTGSGKIEASRLVLSRNGSPAPQPVDIDYNIADDLHAHTGQVQDIAVHTGNLEAHVNGSFQMQPQTTSLNLHLSAPGLPIDGVEQLLPSIGIHLPSGSSLRGGTLTANLAITGTSGAPDIAGPVEIDNTQLAGFNLASKIQGVKALGGNGNATAIRLVKADVHSTVPSTDLTNIGADIPSIGTATGSGSVSAAGTLDFHLLAKLSASGGAGAVISGAANALGGLAGGLLHTAVSNGIPLTITGTTANPSIRADLGAMLKGSNGKSAVQQKPSVAGAVKGLLGH